MRGSMPQHPKIIVHIVLVVQRDFDLDDEDGLDDLFPRMLSHGSNSDTHASAFPVHSLWPESNGRG